MMSRYLVLLFLAVLTVADSDPNPQHGITAVTCQVVTKSGEAKGEIRIVINPEWSPAGVERFKAMVEDKFFNNHPLYRAVPNFLVQFGTAGDPAVQKRWNLRGRIPDDPDKQLAFRPGMLSFAGSGPGSRTTSVFLATSTSDHQLKAFGTQLWETPLGFVVKGLDVLKKVYAGYGDMAEQRGKGPSQKELMRKGNGALGNFPKLDYFKGCVQSEATDKEKLLVNIKKWPKVVRRKKEAKAKRIQVQLTNKSERKMDLYWHSEKGENVFQGSLKPGEKIKQGSFPGHTFHWMEHKAKTVVHKTKIETSQSDYHYMTSADL